MAGNEPGTISAVKPAGTPNRRISPYSTMDVMMETERVEMDVVSSVGWNQIGYVIQEIHLSAGLVPVGEQEQLMRSVMEGQTAERIVSSVRPQTVILCVEMGSERSIRLVRRLSSVMMGIRAQEMGVLQPVRWRSISSAPSLQRVVGTSIAATIVGMGSCR